jgi:cytochrome c
MSRVITRRLLTGFIVAACVGVIACRTESRAPAPIVLGDAERGRKAIERYGCGSCHAIPGIRGARGSVGPSLTGLSRRPYLAGSFVNEPANLISWVREPRRLDPTTIMPNLGVSDADARDIAAFLYRAD